MTQTPSAKTPQEPFDGVDFYGIDSLLSDEEKASRSRVRAWVESDVLPHIAVSAREGRFRKEWVLGIAGLGLLGANLEGYGCLGLNNVAYGLMMQEIERGDSGLRSFCSVQGNLVMWPLHRYGSDPQKDRWLPLLHQGKAIGSFALTEPGHGSNPSGMETRAEKKGNRWVLNGTKRWVTNGTIADVILVWAKTEDGVRGFLVETDKPGVQRHKLEGKLSLRASESAWVKFTDVELDDADILPGVRGLKGPLSCLNQARYGIIWGVLGAAMACYHEALEYAKSRIQFDRPIAGFQLVQQKLVDMLSEITKGQLLALQLGRLKDQGLMKPAQVSLAKRNNVGMALNIARTARDVLGGNGILDEYQSMRHMVNLETVNTYEGTYDIHTLVVGEHITGQNAFL